jgi:hypothetical protein
MTAINEFKRGDIVDVDSKSDLLKGGVIANVEKSSGLYEVKLTLDNDNKTTGIFCKASEMTLKWRFVSTWDELKECAEANLQGKIVALNNGVGIRNYRQGEEFIVEIGWNKGARLITFYSNDARLTGGSDGYHKTLKYGYNTSSTSFNTNFKIYVKPKFNITKEIEKVMLEDIRKAQANKVENLGENDFILFESSSQLERIHDIAKIPFDKKENNWEITYAYDCFCIKKNLRKPLKDVTKEGYRVISFVEFLKDNLETASSLDPNVSRIRVRETQPEIKAKDKAVKDVLREVASMPMPITGRNGVEVKNYQPYKLSNLLKDNKHYVYCNNRAQYEIVCTIAGFKYPFRFDPKYPFINIKSINTACDLEFAKQNKFTIISFDDFVKDNSVELKITMGADYRDLILQEDALELKRAENTLPEKWKLEVYEYQIKDFVNKYRRITIAGWGDNQFICSDLFDSKDKKSWEWVPESECKSLVPDYKEITFDRFKQYVEDNFLPKSWCIRITETNISILRGWIPTTHLGLFLGVCKDKRLGIFTESEVFSMTVITLQEFQKHVLKTEIKQITNDNTVNSIAINSKLYNSNSSQFKQPENGKIAIVQSPNLEISTGNPVRGIGLEGSRSEIIVGNHSSDYKKRSCTSKKGVLKDTVGMSLRYPI